MVRALWLGGLGRIAECIATITLETVGSQGLLRPAKNARPPDEIGQTRQHRRRRDQEAQNQIQPSDINTEAEPGQNVADERYLRPGIDLADVSRVKSLW